MVFDKLTGVCAEVTRMLRAFFLVAERGFEI